MGKAPPRVYSFQIEKNSIGTHSQCKHTAESGGCTTNPADVNLNQSLSGEGTLGLGNINGRHFTSFLFYYKELENLNILGECVRFR